MKDGKIQKYECPEINKECVYCKHFNECAEWCELKNKHTNSWNTCKSWIVREVAKCIQT